MVDEEGTLEARRSLGAELLELIAPSVCPACDLPRRPGAELLCAACTAGVHHWRELRGVLTAVAYEDTAARLIQRFKFERRRDALPLLVEMLAHRLGSLRFDVIVPVPRHPGRIRSQGCDPVFELARALGRHGNHPLLAAALQRSRPTPPQAGLASVERRENVRDSFRAARGSLRGLRVLLLDDVTTTGATLREARRALRRAGPRGVLQAALAATPDLPIAPALAL